MKAHAKINLALVVGPTRPDGFHEVVTVLQRVALHDTVELEPADQLSVEGFADDTLVRSALEAVAAAAGVEPLWHARIEKRIPVAAGLGGGSSDAAAALRLANRSLSDPLSPPRLRELARPLGADVPFFLEQGPQLGTDDGSTLAAYDLPQDYTVVLVLPHDVQKESTAAVYASFAAADGFDQRRARVLATIESPRRARDLAALPPNDLASSPLAAELTALGAFRADVSGAGPTVYGLFENHDAADRAAEAVAARGTTWITTPAW